MSSSWVRGSRCNVDNCRTHYYRVIDGQRICQYGHVYEGHVEYNDEEDDVATVTKKVKLPASQITQSQLISSTQSKKNDANQKIYGIAARELVFKCFQIILKNQSKVLKNKFDLPDAFETIVKSVWIDFLTHYLTENTDEEDSGAYNFTNLPHILHSIAIIYISCRYLNLPIVFFDDLISLISEETLPLMHTHSLIPKNLLMKLPETYRNCLQPPKILIRGEIIFKSLTVISKLNTIRPIRMNYNLFLIKMINEFILPPRIYESTKKVFRILDLNFSYPIVKDFQHNTANMFGKVSELPEIQILFCLLISTKIYFKNPNFNKNNLNFNKWEKIYRKLNKFNSFNNLIKKLPNSKDLNHDILNWNDIQSIQFINWFEKSLINEDYLNNSSLPIKRLFNIFNTDEFNNTLDNLSNQANDINSCYNKLFKTNNVEITKEDLIPLNSNDLLVIEDIFFDHIATNYGTNKDYLLIASRRLERAVIQHYIKSSKQSFYPILL